MTATTNTLQDELLQVVDEHTGEPTGVTAPRAEVINNQMWCRSTNVYILSPDGELLCQQRSLNKERYPGVWSTHFGGHVSADETFKINALKEVEEEVGLMLNAHQLVPWRTSRLVPQRLWVRDFLTIYAGPLDKLTPQASEVEKIEWMTPETIMSELQAEGEFDDMREWIAGTHNFHTDYQCMRAVLTAMLDAGLFSSEFYGLHKWKPVVLE